MEEQRKKPKFVSTMTPLQRTLGWIYLPLHVFVIPVLVMLYQSARGIEETSVWTNLAYYTLGLLFVLIVMLPYLRAEYETLMDRLAFCAITIALGMLAIYALDTVTTLVLLALEQTLNNPNTAEVTDLAVDHFGVVKGLSIFIAPIVEEVLFRGVLFGTIRQRSRGWAYVVSVLGFSLYHVWQSALVTGDWTLLLYAIQYLPVSIVLAWCYDRSGSLWTNIFYHMGFNAVSVAVLQLLM